MPNSWIGEHIQVDSAKIYVESHGSGPTLFCLHNFSSNSRACFDKQISLLSSSYTCLLMDLRGHGRSTNESREWSHTLVADDIIAVLEAKQLSGVRVLAASSGAMAMLKVSRLRPDLIKAMVLDSATFTIPVSARKYYRPYEALSPKLKDYYANANEVYGPEYGKELASIFHDFRLPECDINEPIENLARIVCPTLFLAGDRDSFFPVDIHIAMYNAVSHSELCIFPNTSHIAMASHAAQCGSLTLDFFKRRSS